MTYEQFLLVDYHQAIIEQRKAYHEQIFHVTEKGQNQIKRALKELDDLGTYVNEEFITVPKVRKQKATRDKFHEVLAFLHS